MELKRILIFVGLVSNEISYITGNQITVGHIQVFKKHPKLLECAGSVLRKSLRGERYDKEYPYIAGRISSSEGKCEALSLFEKLKWDDREAVQNAYGYFKFVGGKEVFDPPIRMETFTRILPAVFRAGVKVTVTFREERPSGYIIPFYLGDYWRRKYVVTYENSEDSEHSFVLRTNPETERIETQFAVDTTKMVEFSFWAQTNAIEVHVNGVKIGQFPVDGFSDVDTFSFGLISNPWHYEYTIHSFSVA